MKYTEDQIEDLLKGIYSGKYTNRKLPEDLYFAIAEYLRDGVYDGFGATLAEASESTVINNVLLRELRENVYMFSGAKTYAQVIEMRDLLANVNSYKEFRSGALGIYAQYNKTWLRTEYDTAIGQAQMAVKWDTFQRDKDVLPFLTYSTIGDACDICGPLDKFTAPVDDPIWDVIMPLNHFHCMCLVSSTTEEGSRWDVSEVTQNMDDNFKMNPGKDGYIFSDKHPYFEVAKGDRGFAGRNFDLPIPESD